MIENFIFFKKKFDEIKDMGWVKSLRRGPTGVGYTFESLLGKNEDSFCVPDYMGIEIKTHRKKSKSYIALFSYNPVGESSYELEGLFNKYSYIHTMNKSVRSLNTNVYCNYISDVGIQYKFSLRIDEIEERVYLLVFDRLGYFIEKSAYWSFNTLRDKLYTKMKYLAYIEVESKYINGCEFFKYNKIIFYELRDFDTFISLLNSGKIRVSFLVSGSLNSDEPIKAHGTTFCIKPDSLDLLFQRIYVA